MNTCSVPHGLQNVVKGIQLQLLHPTQPTLLHNIILIGFITAS